MKLPLEQTGFKQLNLGDKLGLGDLWSSFNLNLSKKLGTLLVSGRMLLNINTSDDAQLGAPPCAFKVFITTDTYIWAAANAHMWHSTAASNDGGPNDPFIQDATGSTPTALNSNQTDLLVTLSRLYVTQAHRDVKYLDSGGAWNTITNGLADSSGLHQMTFFRALNRIYIVDDNAAGISVISGTTPTNVAASTQYTLNDLVEGSGGNVGSFISCIASNTNRVGIGTVNLSGNTCKFYTWDGSTGGNGAYGPNEEYNLDASGILAVIVVDDVFIVFDTKGRLMQLNGGTFVEIARLPLEEAPLKIPVSTATNRPVHFNGMSLVDSNIEILINTQLWDTNSTVKENCPSGIWCYDRRTHSFYHKRSFGLTKSGGTITDYGASQVSLVGALAEVEVIHTDITRGSVNGKILAGVRYYTDATATADGIFYDDSNDTLQKAGSFVTQKIFSDNITDIWQKFYARFRKFLNSTDKVVVKARTEDDVSTEATITYVDTTSFTVLASAFTTNPVAGDEVEILQGVGAGRCAHVTSVAGTTTLTIVVDETITGATTQTAKARFQTWKKLGSYNAQVDDFFKVPIDLSLLGASPWIQFKVWILWTGKNEIYDNIISSKVQEAIE